MLKQNTNCYYCLSQIYVGITYIYIYTHKITTNKLLNILSYRKAISKMRNSKDYIMYIYI